MVYLKCSKLSCYKKSLMLRAALTHKAVLFATSLLILVVPQPSNFVAYSSRTTPHVYLLHSRWSIRPPVANAALPSYFCQTNILHSYRPFLDTSLCPLPSIFVAIFLRKPPAFSSFLDSLRVLLRNANDLQTRSVKLLHFISLHPADLIYI